MNKARFVRMLAARLNSSDAAAEAVVNIFGEVLRNALRSNGTVKLVGFGTFSIEKRQARTVYVPYSQKLMVCPERKLIKFRASGLMREAVCGKPAPLTAQIRRAKSKKAVRPYREVRE